MENAQHVDPVAAGIGLSAEEHDMATSSAIARNMQGEQVFSDLRPRLDPGLRGTCHQVSTAEERVCA